MTTVGPTPDVRKLLHLDVEERPNGSPTATMLVKWECTPELVALLRREFVDEDDVDHKLNLYVLLVVRRVPEERAFYYGNTETIRYLVRLEDCGQHVSFSGRGKNEVVAVILNLPSSKAKTAAHKLRDSHDDVLYEDGSFPRYRHSSMESLAETECLEIEVDSRMFARPPARWRRALVSGYFPSKAFDQCEFRGRFIVSLLVFTPLALILGIPLRILTLITALVIGFRDIPWRGLNPFNLYVWPWPEAPRYTVYFHRRNGDVRTLAVPAFFIQPWMFVVVALFAYEFYGKDHWGLERTLAYTVGGLLTLFLGISLFIGGALLLQKIVDAIVHATHKNVDRAEQRRLEQARLDSLRQVNLSKLERLVAAPPRRSFHLFWDGVKSKVCRPYSRW